MAWGFITTFAEALPDHCLTGNHEASRPAQCLMRRVPCCSLSNPKEATSPATTGLRFLRDPRDPRMEIRLLTKSPLEEGNNGEPRLMVFMGSASITCSSTATSAFTRSL